MATLLTCVPKTLAKTSISISVRASARSSKYGRATSKCERRCEADRSKHMVRDILFARYPNGLEFVFTKMYNEVTQYSCSKLPSRIHFGSRLGNACFWPRLRENSASDMITLSDCRGGSENIISGIPGSSRDPCSVYRHCVHDSGGARGCDVQVPKSN